MESCKTKLILAGVMAAAVLPWPGPGLCMEFLRPVWHLFQRRLRILLRRMGQHGF